MIIKINIYIQTFYTGIINIILREKMLIGGGDNELPNKDAMRIKD